MDITLFNSLTDKVEKFIPLEPKKVSIYVCGPTVYGPVHIGNLRPVITFDVLRRLFLYLGYEVNYTSNITDVDDKIINTALEEGVSEDIITQRYTDYYFWALDAVNALIPTNIPKVTENMVGIINFIEELIKQDYAYVVEGDVYFKIDKLDDYGKLSNLKIDDLKIGARIEENVKKENSLDFTLWKKTDVGVKFSSPWSEGRPGWHTECVVMINELYPNGRIDIHGGGFDLKFPHHENEIAQSEACHKHPIATYWVHNGFVNIDDEKMSKSLGNVKFANEILKEYGGNAVRLTMLNSHYRAPINFSDDILSSFKNEDQRFTMALRKAEVELTMEGITTNSKPDPLLIDKFLRYVGDDLNTANAIMVLNEVFKELNVSLRAKKYDRLAVLIKTIRDMSEVLGLYYPFIIISKEDVELYKNWQTLKDAKNFVEADKLRDILIVKGLM